MKKTLSLLVVLFAAFLLLPSTASAQSRHQPVRVRGGVAAAGGAIVVPDHPGGFAVGTAGVQGEVGIQFLDLVGLYWVPQLDVAAGPNIGGVNLSTAAVVDIAPIDEFSVAVGPDLGVFAAVGDDGLAAGLTYGARLRLNVNPYVYVARNGRRQALTLGIDVRLMRGAVGVLADESSASDFAFQPMLTLGYRAF